MNSEQEETLIQYLASAGFEGEQLEKQLKENIALHRPNFSIKHVIPYGEERMTFELKFRREDIFDVYLLESYKATHRAALAIEHKVIHGIDTARLEERMAGQDWDAFFNDRLTDPNQKTYMAETVDLLGRLTAGQDFNGSQIRDLLMFKYWPAGAYRASSIEDYTHMYERSRDFHPTAAGICPAHLAYHITSGHLDQLHESLQYMNLNQFPGVDVYAMLSGRLSKAPGDFELKLEYNDAEGFSEIRLPIQYTPEGYEAEQFTHVFTPYPPIAHGSFNGIDTAVLEALMREIDWNDDSQLFILHEEREPEFLPKVAEVLDQMSRLRADPAGAEIADMLQLKFWSDASFFDGLMDQRAWDKLAQLPKRSWEFPIEMDAKASRNLLCGRTVNDMASEPDEWLRFNFNKVDSQGLFTLERLKGFPQKALEEQLKLLPIPNHRFYPVRNGIQRGDLVTVPLNDERKVVMEANPEGRTINIYTAEMRPIPMNLHLDPDWELAIKHGHSKISRNDIRPSIKKVLNRKKRRGI